MILFREILGGIFGTFTYMPLMAELQLPCQLHQSASESIIYSDNLEVGRTTMKI